MNDRCLIVGRVLDHGEEFSGWRGARGAKDDATIFANHDDGARDPLQFADHNRPLRLEGVVGVGDPQSFVDQEIERKIQLVDESLVTLGIPLVDADRFGVECSKLRDCLANGGQLIASATGHVFGIEEEERALRSPE